MLMLYISMIDGSEEKRKFEQLYLAHKQTMYYVAFSILKNAQDAEDAVHKAFLRLMVRIEKINDVYGRETRSYLVVITQCAAIDIYRKRKISRVLSYDEVENYIPSNMESDFNEKASIICAVNKLSINDSVVLKLRYSYGHSNAEIASILQITEDSVRQRISRAKKRLAKRLAEEGVFL